MVELYGGKTASSKLFLKGERGPGRNSILPPDGGRFPSAGRGPSEAVRKTPPFLPLAKHCEPGRFAVRRGQCQDSAHRSGRI